MSMTEAGSTGGFCIGHETRLSPWYGGGLEAAESEGKQELLCEHWEDLHEKEYA